MTIPPFQLMTTTYFSSAHKLRLVVAVILLLFFHRASLAQIGAEHLISTSQLGGALDFELVDIDNDGDLDAIFGELNTNTVSWFENVGGGNFASVQLISSGIVNSPQSIAIGDINGDGFPDVLAPALANSSRWYASLGNGSFSAPNLIPYSESSSISRATINDFDNDGDNDIVMYSRGTDAFFFIENTGGGVLANAVLIADNVPEYVRSIAAADFDNDGLLDFAFTSDQNPTIGWLKNLTGTTFGPIQLTTNMIYDPNCLKAFDLDYDGDMDLIFSSSGLGGIAWIENLGNSTFSNVIPIGTSSVPEAFGMGHINDDGYVDFFTASSSPIGDGVYWFENSQNLSWSQPSGYGAPSSSLPKDISVGDIDNDGDDDVAVILMGSLRWYENYQIPPNILKGTVFHDENANGIMDMNESGLNAGNVFISPGMAYSYPNSQGEFTFANTPGTYTLRHNEQQLSPLWSLTSDSSLTVTTGPNDPPIDELNFGYSINLVESDYNGFVTGSMPLCDQQNVYWIDLWNQGTTKPHGIIEVQLDDSTSFVSASVSPDSIVGNVVYWHFDSLDYFDHQMITYYVQMPSLSSVGQMITTVSSFKELNSAGNVVNSISHYYSEILACSYEPNNKSVMPEGVGSEGIITQVPDLEYTIRFQNTGNFTATNVMITDTLDSNLDWGSLRFLSSSHPVNISIDSSGVAKFKFTNIYLPDSASNEPESHGYVKFEIDLVPGLALGDEIRNKANIFFDSNPPIITNSVLNTIGDPNSSDEAQLIVYPNPTYGEFSVLVKTSEPTNTLFISDLSGRILHTEPAHNGQIIPMDLTDFRSGFYILFLSDSNKRIVTKENLVKL